MSAMAATLPAVATFNQCNDMNVPFQSAGIRIRRNGPSLSLGGIFFHIQASFKRNVTIVLLYYVIAVVFVGWPIV